MHTQTHIHTHTHLIKKEWLSQMSSLTHTHTHTHTHRGMAQPDVKYCICESAESTLSSDL